MNIEQKVLKVEKEVVEAAVKANYEKEKPHRHFSVFTRHYEDEEKRTIRFTVLINPTAINLASTYVELHKTSNKQTVFTREEVLDFYNKVLDEHGKYEMYKDIYKNVNQHC